MIDSIASGRSAASSPVTERDDGDADEHEADGDRQARREQLQVEPAVPRSFAARSHARQHAGTRSEGDGSLARRRMMFPSSQPPTAGDP